MRHSNILAAVAIAMATGAAAAGPWLKVDESSVTECGDVTFTWGGATDDDQNKFTAYSNLKPSFITWVKGSSGSGTWKNMYAARDDSGAVVNNRVVFTLEDGLGNQAVPSKLITVGANKSGSACKTSGAPAWQFGLDPKVTSTLSQCSSLTFDTRGLKANENVTIAKPIKVTGIIPGVVAWEENFPPDSEAWTMVANIAKDRTVIFSLRDRNDAQGGATDFMTVVGSSDTSCLGSSTWGANGSKSGIPKKGLSAGAIAGIVVGVVVGLALILGLGFFFWRRSRRSGNAGRPQEISPAVDLYDATTPEPKPFKGGYAGVPNNVQSDQEGSVVSPYYGGSSDGGRGVSQYIDGPASFGGSQYGDHHRAMSQSGAGSQYGSPGPMSPTFMPMPGPSAPAPLIGKHAVAAQEPLEPQYRIQADAGRIPQPSAGPAPAVIDMPPTYNPEWQAEDDTPAAAAPVAHSSQAGSSLAAEPRDNNDFRLSARTNQTHTSS